MNADVRTSADVFLDRVYYPAVKYRIHISLIFLFLLVSSFTAVAGRPVVWPVVAAFSLWHFALYIFDRAYDFDKDILTQPQEAIRPEERNFWLGISFVCAALPLVILPWAGLSVWPYLPFIPVTFLYTFPVYRGMRAKNITLVKNLYSALLIWTLPLSVVVYSYGGSSHGFGAIFKQYFLGMFLYVMVGEAFWDIRDVEGDRLNNVRTLPVRFGIFVTKIYLALLIAADIFVFGRPVGDSAMIYSVLIVLVGSSTPNWVYHLPPLLGLYRFLKPLFVDIVVKVA